MAFTMSVRCAGLMADTSSETSTMNVSVMKIVVFAGDAFVTFGGASVGVQGAGVT